MLRIVKHIKSLLSEHDCVIVPDFGGFVSQNVATSVENRSHLFSPSRKEIVFNETLQHNDGLLIGSYMKSEQCDYPTAQQLVREDVYAVKEALKKKKEISFEKIGHFVLGGENQLIFRQGDAEWLNANNYGLSSFTFEPLAKLTADNYPAKVEERRNEVYYIPISRQFIRIVAASIVALILFLGTSIPVKDIDRAAYTASFIPMEMVQPSTWQHDGKPVRPAESSEENIIHNLEDEAKVEAVKAPAKANAPSKAKAEKAKEPSKAKTATMEAAPAKADKKYNVVIGSFPTQGQADQFMKEMNRNECPHMDVIVKNGKYRVYAESFNNRDDAEKYMAEIRKNSKYKDAWLFICR